MQTIYVAGCNLHVRFDGPEDGPVVMFSNSLGTELRVWDLMRAHLPKGLRLVRYDKRGHGLSDCPEGPYSIDMLAGDAAAIADAFDLRDVTFVGLSIGGLIGQALALSRPDIVKSLVLMDTGAKIGTAELWAERIAALEVGGLEGMADAVMDRWFSAGMRNDEPALAPWRNMLLRTPVQGYKGCCEAIAAADYSDKAKALSIPVMAMVGNEDRATTPDLVRATAELYNAPFHVIKEAGHLPCVEKPAEAAKLIVQFMESTDNE